MAWVETSSLSFVARHESAHADVALALLERLEEFRSRLDGRFDQTPGDVAVVIHPSPGHLSLSQPWLPLARMATAPAARRYLAGWFSSGEIHVLAPAVLDQRASGSPGSREALELSPLHEYAHLVVGANNPRLPPPFTPGSFARYLRSAWQCEGAATFFSGQLPHLRAAIVRRLREGRIPDFPPSARDAQLLGGTVYSLLEHGAGPEACVDLASHVEPRGGREALERAYMRSLDEVERDWREYLDSFTAG